MNDIIYTYSLSLSLSLSLFPSPLSLFSLSPFSFPLSSLSLLFAGLLKHIRKGLGHFLSLQQRRGREAAAMTCKICWLIVPSSC